MTNETDGRCQRCGQALARHPDLRYCVLCADKIFEANGQLGISTVALLGKHTLTLGEQNDHADNSAVQIHKSGWLFDAPNWDAEQW